MTAPAGAGGGKAPWKARWAAAILATILVVVAPAAGGSAIAGAWHGLGVIGCHLSPTTCAPTPDGGQQIKLRLPSPQDGPPPTWNN